ncbi:MAG: Gas vesicle synthesis GvpLGvpF [Dehalococcoidia bacterium]|nr:Gas vesicle synthesis GvpLGvpF [Dehalococcoidia bacterium]
MELSAEGLRHPLAGAVSARQQAGRYIYCVAGANEVLSLGSIGIEGREVHAVVHNDLCALVHDCVAQPYQSDDAQVATAWVLAHHQVVEAAWHRWGAVLPLTFNTIIEAGDGRSAEENLSVWLNTEYQVLRGKLDALTGKAEYGVQVSWAPSLIAGKIAETSPDMREMEEGIRSRPRGIAYMYRQRLESLLRKEMEARAAEEFKELYSRLSRCVDSIHVEKTRAVEEGRQMLLNLSCLVSLERYPDLAAELDRVGSREGFFVRLAGPLPPYSFC